MTIRAGLSLLLLLVTAFGQSAGTDVNTAIPTVLGQPLQVVGDPVTRAHVVYAISLPANQLFTIQFTRQLPYRSLGYDVSFRLSLYPPATQSIFLLAGSGGAVATSEIGDVLGSGTGVLNYYAAAGGTYYLDFLFFTPSGMNAQTSTQAPSAVEPAGSDVSSATPVAIGQTFYSLGDSFTKPHAVYSIMLPANQLFSMKITRIGPWVSMGYESVARALLYPSNIQTVQVFNPDLVDADVGDYATTAVLNYRVAVAGRYYLDFRFFRPGILLRAEWLSPTAPTTITSVNVSGGGLTIAQNSWIEIKGTTLAPADTGPNGVIWSGAPEFAAGRMPTALRGVSVRVNGKPAYIYYVSPTQVNALTPLDNAIGPVQVILTNGSDSSLLAATMSSSAPAFLLFAGTKYIAATHANGTLLGPTSMSVANYPFTPARPGETVVLYGTGFGLPSTPLIDGSSSQSGSLPTAPVIQIGGSVATVAFSGVVSPGLYQFNVVIPASVASGDNATAASYGGSTTPAGTLLNVQR